MIGYVTIHYKDKRRLEEYIISHPSFENVTMKKNIKTDNVIYPIEASQNKILYRIDDYKGYLNLNLRSLYFDVINSNYSSFYCYSQHCISIDILSKKTIDLNNSTLSRLSIVFYINPNVSSKHLIKSNIIMHKYTGYNHNLFSTSRRNLKQFEHFNFLIGVSFLPSKKDNLSNTLKIELRLLKSNEYKKYGISNINDLRDKNKLNHLFSMFLRRFDELTIIDDIADFDLFSEKDKIDVIKYLNPDFWHLLTLSGRRQKKLWHKRNFERIQNEYKLNTLKCSLRESIIISFNHFINN